MLEPLTGFHDLRANPQVMIKGKAAPFLAKRKEVPPHESDDLGYAESQGMTPEEQRLLQELKLRDTAVREEEEAHARMLGRHAGATRYEYQIGPDGRVYVINGSVEVDPKFNSSNPDEIRRVLQTIQRAAVSVSNPSQADLNVAASAANKASIMSKSDVISKYSTGAEFQSVSSIPAQPASMSTQLNAQA